MTVRRSPQTERLVDVVEMLSDPPGRRSSLTAIAAALGLDKATVYPMLTELTRVGWVVKHPTTKTYRLGPALVRIGDAAGRSIAELAPTSRAIAVLAEATGQLCCVVVPSGDDLLIAGVRDARRSQGDGLQLRSGDRITFRPPLGSVLVAWSDDLAISDWLDRNPVPGQCDHRLPERLAAVRARHFSVEQYPANVGGFRDLASAATGAGIRGSRRTTAFVEGQRRTLDMDVLVGVIDERAWYQPLSVSAPIFDVDGDAVGALCVLESSEPVTGTELTRRGELVSSVAAQVTDHLGGSAPWN
ncbi:IclR family transcriptional regulator [Williamsia sp.]|uniref:IclR family transcriptional regulator n=1 Tax=Williamsia sp. TaxID=1872085 RepID=UPI002F953A1E